jgi:sugar phosphate isomerase/epimerase
MKKQYFTKKTAVFATLLSLLFCFSCKENTKEKSSSDSESTEIVAKDGVAKANTEWKLSLAQWSIHKMILEEGVDPFDFPQIAADWGFDGVEYVSQLYQNYWEQYDTKQDGIDALVAKLNAQSLKAGVENLIIMVDGEGDLSVNDEAARNQAVENHKIWVDAAAALGCHSIRINLFGSFKADEWRANSIDAMTKLATYAKDKNVNVIVENHGWLSSDTPELMKVIAAVNMDNAGTLPDFGNFCVKRKDGAKWGECEKEYPDIYKGVKLMMPAAKAVSAKSYDFDEKGNETKIDYGIMLKIVKNAGYTGYIGVEYEGTRLSEKEGVMATKNLILNGPFE